MSYLSNIWHSVNVFSILSDKVPLFTFVIETGEWFIHWVWKRCNWIDYLRQTVKVKFSSFVSFLSVYLFVCWLNSIKMKTTGRDFDFLKIGRAFWNILSLTVLHLARRRFHILQIRRYGSVLYMSASCYMRYCCVVCNAHGSGILYPIDDIGGNMDWF